MSEPKTKWESRERDRIRKYVRDLRESSPCIDCGGRFPWYIMEFDHCRGTKRRNMSGMCSISTLTEVIYEIKKCDLLCANCHKIRTHNRRVSDNNR